MEQEIFLARLIAWLSCQSQLLIKYDIIYCFNCNANHESFLKKKNLKAHKHIKCVHSNVCGL